MKHEIDIDSPKPLPCRNLISLDPIKLYKDCRAIIFVVYSYHHHPLHVTTPYQARTYCGKTKNLQPKPSPIKHTKIEGKKSTLTGPEENDKVSQNHKITSHWIQNWPSGKREKICHTRLPSFFVYLIVKKDLTRTLRLAGRRKKGVGGWRSREWWQSSEVPSTWC
jgi:hypothetical protein